MGKVLLRVLIGISVAVFVWGTPPAYAIFGIRAARKVIAAREAEKRVASPSADKDDVRAVPENGTQAVDEKMGWPEAGIREISR